MSSKQKITQAFLGKLFSRFQTNRCRSFRNFMKNAREELCVLPGVANNRLKATVRNFHGLERPFVVGKSCPASDLAVIGNTTAPWTRQDSIDLFASRAHRHFCEITGDTNGDMLNLTVIGGAQSTDSTVNLPLMQCIHASGDPAKILASAARASSLAPPLDLATLTAESSLPPPSVPTASAATISSTGGIPYVGDVVTRFLATMFTVILAVVLLIRLVGLTSLVASYWLRTLHHAKNTEKPTVETSEDKNDTQNTQAPSLGSVDPEWPLKASERTVTTEKAESKTASPVVDYPCDPPATDPYSLKRAWNGRHLDGPNPLPCYHGATAYRGITDEYTGFYQRQAQRDERLNTPLFDPFESSFVASAGFQPIGHDDYCSLSSGMTGTRWCEDEVDVSIRHGLGEIRPNDQVFRGPAEHAYIQPDVWSNVHPTPRERESTPLRDANKYAENEAVTTDSEWEILVHELQHEW